jgi:hypothetical protein
MGAYSCPVETSKGISEIFPIYDTAAASPGVGGFVLFFKAFLRVGRLEKDRPIPDLKDHHGQ